MTNASLICPCQGLRSHVALSAWREGATVTQSRDRTCKTELSQLSFASLHSPRAQIWSGVAWRYVDLQQCFDRFSFVWQNAPNGRIAPNISFLLFEAKDFCIWQRLSKIATFCMNCVCFESILEAPRNPSLMPDFMLLSAGRALFLWCQEKINTAWQSENGKLTAFGCSRQSSFWKQVCCFFFSSYQAMWSQDHFFFQRRPI